MLYTAKCETFRDVFEGGNRIDARSSSHPTVPVSTSSFLPPSAEPTTHHPLTILSLELGESLQTNARFSSRLPIEVKDLPDAISTSYIHETTSGLSAWPIRCHRCHPFSLDIRLFLCLSKALESRMIRVLEPCHPKVGSPGGGIEDGFRCPATNCLVCWRSTREK